MLPRIDRQFLRTRAGIFLVAVSVVVLLGTLVAALRPLPRRDLAIATGPPGSVYALSAERYRQILASDGVRLHLVPTDGAVANVKLLKDPKSGVDAGFVQAGTVSENEARGLVSLGTVFYDTLLDENAASHIALGQGYEFAVDDQSERERVNRSEIHVDFMIGTNDVAVTGLTREGREVPLLREGAWQL